MKTPFSSPCPPHNVAKHFVHVYWFPTLKRGEGEATFHEGREENLNPRNNGCSFACVSTTFVHDCSSGDTPGICISRYTVLGSLYYSLDSLVRFLCSLTLNYTFEDLLHPSTTASQAV